MVNGGMGRYGICFTFRLRGYDDMGNMSTKSKKYFRVLSRYDEKCAYCGAGIYGRDETTRGNATVDHIIPQSKDGTNAEDNLLPCCRSCNSSKGSKTLYGYRMSCLFKAVGAPPFSDSQKYWLLKHGIDIDSVAEKLFGAPYTFYFERRGETGGANDN